jgi:uncharacterized protein YjbJ (UPF0337 family)
MEIAMTSERFTGLCLQLSGSINRAWGELSGNPVLEASGRRDQVIGRARQVSAIEQEAAARQFKDFQHHNRNWNF